MYGRIRVWVRRNLGISVSEANGYLVLMVVLLLLHFGITRFWKPSNFDLEPITLADSVSRLLWSNQDSLERSRSPDHYSSSIDSAEVGTGTILPHQKYQPSSKRYTAVRKETNSSQHRSQFQPQIRSSGDGNRPSYPPKELNRADSVWFKTIYGIGPVLSSRIVKYRDLLGGFVSQNQLFEVYGLSPEVIERLRRRLKPGADLSLVRKLSINQAEYHDLAAHPYLSYNQARAMVAYREQHGPFETIEAVKKIHLIDDSTYLRVRPYLDF